MSGDLTPFRALSHAYRPLLHAEFIEVDKKESALECLNDVIHSKKHRQSWSTTHELIMRLFVELCVDLQRSAFAKDGLYQYRNICREVSLNSFEVVSLIAPRSVQRTYTYTYSTCMDVHVRWCCCLVSGGEAFSEVGQRQSRGGQGGVGAGRAAGGGGSRHHHDPREVSRE